MSRHRRSTYISKFSTLLLAASVLVLPGCRVRVDKTASGEEKNVQVDTPFGGVHVNTDKTTASDLGLPVYPGATVAADEDNHKSADIHMGFGQWQLRVKAVTYQSTDDRQKIIDFYRTALSHFGDVIACDGNKPIGTPAVTREGLTCADDNKSSTVQVNNDSDWAKDLQLKAGSRHHQHIVGFEKPSGGVVKFGLVALDLPQTSSGDDGKD